MLARSLPFAIAATVFLLDRITKRIVQANISSWDTIRVIPGFFNLVHAENRGVAFGLFSDSTSPWRSVILVGLSIAVMVFVVSLLWKPGHGGLALRIGLALVLGGAIGNLYDRVVHGTVTDFVEIYEGTHYFPAFNVADSAISVGAALLLLDMWRGRERTGEIHRASSG
jgi:signal peptidase II